MKKRIVLYLILTSFIVGTTYYVTQALVPTEPIINLQKFKFDQYYVPVTNYWASISDIKIDDLKKNQNLIIEKNELQNLTKPFGEAIKNNPKKEIDEIQKGLKDGEIAIVKWSDVTPNLKTLSVDGRYLWNKKDVVSYSLKTEVEYEDPKMLAGKFNLNKLTKLTSIGDVILGRTVAKKMAQYGVRHPWEKVSARIADADVTFADLETPLSDRVPAPYEGMSFIAPAKAIEGLTNSGIDIVALANNHSTNFGTNVFWDTLSLLSQNKIKYVGGGKDLTEAEKSQILEVNGQKWAFLDYNSIIGAINATEDSSGVARFRVKPWSETDNEEDIKKIENAIQEAKKVSDVVVVEFHWGVEYTADPIESQKKVARRAIDAGADLIIGTHPHWVQGSEIYKGKYITYSLGNFIFDQEWSTETKQGTILESYFYGKKQFVANLVPVQIEDYNQPRFVEGALAKSILDRIKNTSVGF